MWTRTTKRRRARRRKAIEYASNGSIKLKSELVSLIGRPTDDPRIIAAANTFKYRKASDFTTCTADNRQRAADVNVNEHMPVI